MSDGIRVGKEVLKPRKWFDLLHFLLLPKYISLFSVLTQSLSHFFSQITTVPPAIFQLAF